MSSVIGIVLAGGLSSRMGTDKAMLSYSGQTLLSHQLKLLGPLCARVLVSGDYKGYDCIPDAIDRCGPLGGIYSVAMHCTDSALLFISVDTLQVSNSHIKQLTHSSVACYFSGQPLPAFFPDSKQLLSVILTMQSEPEQGFSLRRLHERMASIPLNSDDFAPLNINTSSDWQNLEKNYYK